MTSGLLTLLNDKRAQSNLLGRFGLTLLLSLFASSFVQAQDQEKPNILIIWGDDVGWFNTSAYNRGMMGYKTPNIDSIASEGAL